LSLNLQKASALQICTDKGMTYHENGTKWQGR